MTRWDITPSGVQHVLQTTGKTAEGLGGRLKSMGTHLSDAAHHAGTLQMSGGAGEGQSGGHGGGDDPGGGSGKGGSSGMGLVGAALGQFSQKKEHDLAFLMARSGKSIKGAADATAEYAQGDTEMAADAQHNATQAPDINLGKGQANGHGGGQHGGHHGGK